MSESIGQQLKKEREARFLTLEKASAATRIRIVFLQALESDDYSVMPSAAQGRGFLRNYAEYLELNVDDMVAEIQRNAKPIEVSGPLPQVNLVETEIPPLTDAEDEKPARLSWWTSWLGRRPKAESALQQIEDKTPEDALAISEVEVEEKTPQPVIVEPVTKPAEVAETKAEEPILPIEAEQATVNPERETESNLISKFLSLFQSRFTKKESQLAIEIPVVIEPEVPQNIPSQPADVIFAEIGAMLR